MTIYDISEKAGVSIATVSRVLNGSSRVSEKTRQKVLDAIEKYGYTPNAFARGLGLGTIKTIGILCADSSDLYLAKAVYYIEQKLRANGYGSILCCTGYEPEAKAASMNLLIGKKVDAVILTGSNFVHDRDEDNQYIADAALQLPVMLLNASLDCPNVYSVVSDDFSSMYAAARHMLLTGVKDVLYFYSAVSYSGQKKLAGFRAAMEEAGLWDERLICRYSGSQEDIPAMTGQLKELREKKLAFHGVVASDDALALAAVKYARQEYFRIPEDFSVTGCNNSILARCSDPELTSIDTRLETLCQHLISTLMGVLAGNEMPKTAVFSGELIHRGTTR